MSCASLATAPCSARCVSNSVRPSAAPRASLLAPAPLLRAAKRHSRFAIPNRSVRVFASAATSTNVSAKELNSKFGKAGSVEVVEGRGGLPTVALKHSSGSTAEVTLFGGCVTSWKNGAGTEVLYIRPDAVFDKSKPISGGIPHCFPQFGPGNIQLHGFARNVDWELGATSADGGKAAATLVLSDSDYTRKMWPHSFKVEYTVTLDGDSLHTSMAVSNTGDKEFEFTGSLHSYFGVTDIQETAVTGLKGLEYLDRVADAKHPTLHRELRESVTFSGPVDAVYRGVKGPLRLGTGKGTVTLGSSGWGDAVLWTPWTAMEACYREFVCVENAQFGFVALKPGEVWTAGTSMLSAADPLEQFCNDNPDADECKVFD